MKMEDYTRQALREIKDVRNVISEKASIKMFPFLKTVVENPENDKHMGAVLDVAATLIWLGLSLSKRIKE